MKKLSIATALLFAFGTVTFAQDQQASKQKAATPAAKSNKKAAPAKSTDKTAAPKAATMKADNKGAATPASQK